MQNRTKGGIAGILLVMGGMTVHGYASTSTISMQEGSSDAGFGAAVVEKLKINDVDVTYDNVNKNQASNIIFTVNPVTTSAVNDTVAWMKVNPASPWTSCGTLTNGTTTITCPYSGAVTDIGSDGNGGDGGLQLVTAE